MPDVQVKVVITGIIGILAAAWRSAGGANLSSCSCPSNLTLKGVLTRHGPAQAGLTEIFQLSCSKRLLCAHGLERVASSRS
jgi:hypothetical protein